MKKSLNINLFLITIFIVLAGTLTFGFAWYNFSIPTPFFRVTDSFMILIYLLFYVFIVKKHRLRYAKTPLKFYYYFLLFLLVLAFKNVIFGEVSPKEIFKKMTFIYTAVFIFPLAELINSRKNLIKLVNYIFIISFIASVVYYFQFFTGITLEASAVSPYKGINRVNYPGINIMNLSLFIALSQFFVYGFKISHIFKYLVALMALMANVLTLGRGLVFAMLAGIFIIIFIYFYYNRQAMLFIRLFFLSVSVLLFMLILVQTGFDYTLVQNRFEQGIEDISEGSGSYNTRTEMISVRYEYILENAPLMGIGFAYYVSTDEEELESKDYYLNPLALNGDSTVQNIMLISGFSGLLLLILHFIKSIKDAKQLYTQTKDKILKTIALSMISLTVFIILHSFSANYFSIIGFLMIVLNTGIITILYKINENSYFVGSDNKQSS